MKKLVRVTALVLAGMFLISCAACGESNTAASMWLVRTEGTVSVKDGGGKDIAVAERLGLFSGYGIATASSSYGWVSLDDTKFSKLDELSRAGVVKDGKSLELTVLEGSAYFNVTKPLEADETMTIRSANMVTAIRGTSGWVRVESEERMYVYILDGTVECSVTDPATGDTVTEKVTAGEYADMSYIGGVGYIDKGEFAAEDVPGFVRDETDEWEDLPTAESAGPSDEPSAEPTSPADGSNEPSEGNIAFAFDQGVLTVSGSGAMPYYNSERVQPWFDHAVEIRKVVIEDGITHIGGSAFYGLPNLEEAEIADSVTSIGDSAFSLTPKLKRVTLPENLASIGFGAFNGSGLETVTVPESVTEIGFSAFGDCASLASIEILGPVETLTGTFYDCVSLTDIRLPSALGRIDEFAFSHTGIAGIVIPDGVTYIGENAFAYCENLTEIHIPDGVTYIGEAAFMSCGSLTEVHIPDGVTYIGEAAFASCGSLTEVHIPDGVTHIGRNAFARCADLTEIYIPASVLEFGDYVFDGDDALTDVYFGGSEEQWETRIGSRLPSYILDRITVHFGAER